MGQGRSTFTEEELDDYQDLTYFSKKEILHIHKVFRSLSPKRVAENKNARLSCSCICQLPELRVNPFAHRLCKVFSSSQDGDCSFEDFLDMMSVLSIAAPVRLKAEYAFRIFDFDGDDMLGEQDLREVVNLLTGPRRLTKEEMQQLIGNVLQEADLDDDGMLSFAEFEHVISKSPDFVNAFRIQL